MFELTIFFIMVSILGFGMSLCIRPISNLLKQEPESFEDNIMNKLREKRKLENTQNKYPVKYKYEKSYKLSELTQIRNNKTKQDSIVQVLNQEVKNDIKDIIKSPKFDDLQHLKLAYNYINNYQYNTEPQI